MHRKFVLIAAALATFSLGGCISPDTEAKIAATVAAVKKGIAVTNAAINQAVNETCAAAIPINASVNGAAAVAQTFGNGPRTQEAVSVANQALAALNDACTRAAANPNDPRIKSVLLAAWSAYQQAKAAQRQMAGGV